MFYFASLTLCMIHCFRVVFVVDVALQFIPRCRHCRRILSDGCHHCSQCCRSCCCCSCFCCRYWRHQSFCCCRRLCPRFKLHQFNFLLLLVWVMALNCFENEFLQVATPSTLTTSTTSVTTATTITVVTLLQKNYNNLLNNYSNIKTT